MTKEKALEYFNKKLEEAQSSEYVNKPIAWALHQTWKYVDEREPSRVTTRVMRVNIDAEEIFKAMLAHLGYDKEGHDLGFGTGGGTQYELNFVTLTDAKRIKRYVDKQMNQYDKYCELHYDKKEQIARYDIVS